MIRIRNNQDGLALAAKVAELSKFRIRVGAVATDRKGRILSVATNVIKTHPVQAHFAKRQGQEHRIHLHAEINALIHADNAEKVYVARIDLKGQIKPACPCPICMAYITENNVEVIHT